MTAERLVLNPNIPRPRPIPPASEAKAGSRAARRAEHNADHQNQQALLNYVLTRLDAVEAEVMRLRDRPRPKLNVDAMREAACSAVRAQRRYNQALDVARVGSVDEFGMASRSGESLERHQ